MSGKSFSNFLRFIFNSTIVLFLSTELKAQLFESIFNPEHYIAYRCNTPLKIDGILDEDIWKNAPWSSAFVDIEGRDMPKPEFETNIKMLWDEKCLYIGARLYDNHIWATLTKRESVIFEDNDFEIFIDPDGDTHEYMELEINAFGTEWDLFMNKPYRDGGYADNNWNFSGIKSAVKVYGKINRTTGKDSCWTVEIALPWKSLIPFSDTKKIPADGEQWRMNFSRVQWKVKIKDFEYYKEKGKNGKPLPEMNWVWSPQGEIAMHQPETWGYVQFSEIIAGEGIADYIENPDNMVVWSLWQVYYLFQRYPHNFKKAEESLAELKNKKSASKLDFKPVKLGTKSDDYLAKAPSTKKNGYWFIRKDGKVWFEPSKK